MSLREKDRDNFCATRTNILEDYVFLKTGESSYSYYIIGSDGCFEEDALLKNCYQEFTPLIDIRAI